MTERSVRLNPYPPYRHQGRDNVKRREGGGKKNMHSKPMYYIHTKGPNCASSYPPTGIVYQHSHSKKQCCDIVQKQRSHLYVLENMRDDLRYRLWKVRERQREQCRWADGILFKFRGIELTQ